MATTTTKTCDLCGADAEPTGYASHALYGVKLTLQRSTEPIWGNHDYPAHFTGELCEECVDHLTAAVVTAVVEAKAEAPRRRIRRDAMMIASVFASNPEECFATPGVPGFPKDYPKAYELAVEAYKHAADDRFRRRDFADRDYAEGSLEWAEAHALLETGWSPS